MKRTDSEQLRIRVAGPDDYATILGLIDDAAAWLRTKNTDQWASPWPDYQAREERIQRGLREHRTWLVEDADAVAVATISITANGNPLLWDSEALDEPAVYVSRLVVSRQHAGWGIGAALIDWAGQRAVYGWDARWIRIDVWTTNEALHDFYKKRGFVSRGIAVTARGKGYPSAALFQKPTDEIDHVAAARFAC